MEAAPTYAPADGIDYGYGNENEMTFAGEGMEGGDSYGDSGDLVNTALVGVHNGEEYASLPADILNARPKPRLTEEEKLARDCMRRRQSDLERRARIFDAKRRMIGVDKEALDAQVAEKQAAQSRDKGLGKKGDLDMVQIDKQLKLIEIEKQRQRREHEIACKEFSLQQLSFEQRREHDLNDPLAKRKGIPARLGDDDPRCGASSMQKFSGEDLMKDERMRQQRAAMVNFIEQQKFEKAMLTKKSQEAEKDNAFAMQVEEITALRNDIEANEVLLRKELQRRQYDDNLAQANENQERRNALVRANMDANERELNFHKEDKFLNEQAAQHFNNRVIRDAYKGCSRDERVQVGLQQQQQRLEVQTAKATDAAEDRQFANKVEATRRSLVAMERDKQRVRRQMQEQMVEENKRLQLEQKANTKHLNRLYKNEFSPEFFEQFGNGCR